MKQLTVLSHNAFWFQGVPFLSDVPPEPHPEVLKRLCAIYREVNPDVICLQEVQGQETFEMVSAHLGTTGYYSPGIVLPQYGGAVSWHPDSGRIISSSQGSVVKTQRMWQTVEVAGNDCRLRICNAHLPSERQLGRERAATQRIAELEDAIRSCEAGPDVITGDFNERPAGPVGECLERHGYVDTAVLSDSADVPTNIGDGRGDYIWIKRQLGNCMVEYGVAGKQELACDDTGKQYLSDHLPLWITLELR